MVKNLPANAEATGDTGSIPGSGDPREEEMATCSSLLAGKSQGRSPLVGHSLECCQEQDTVSTAQDSKYIKKAFAYLKGKISVCI